ncbi:MAG: carboxypeptidase regulatory-like domain-containing protein [Trueperaceae bacterium]|nr:carboxypeptidase regulatory-like domain-containing protein [Trueperaceae bacterium]
MHKPERVPLRCVRGAARPPVGPNLFLLVALLTVVLTTVSTALAGAGRLAAGDEQLSSGEYFDRVIFSGSAGDVVVIELTSSEFDPYLLIIDGNEQVVAHEDDSPGMGLNVRLTFTLPSTGQYTLIVTSALPGETGMYSLLITTPGQIAKGTASTPSVPSQPVANPQPRTVTGTVVDSHGRPISGARVTMNPALTTGSVSTSTDASGRYVFEGLIDVPYRILAWTYVPWNGRDICLRLGMESPTHYDAFVPTQGSVRNFVMTFEGFMGNTREEIFQFGGLLTLDGAYYYESAGNRLEVHFTPTGPSIDGSTIAPFTRTIEPRITNTIGSLPIAPYTISVTLVGGDGSRRPVRFTEDWWGDPLDTVNIDFAGNGDCNAGSGFDRTYVSLEMPE